MGRPTTPGRGLRHGLLLREPRARPDDDSRGDGTHNETGRGIRGHVPRWCRFIGAGPRVVRGGRGCRGAIVARDVVGLRWWRRRVPFLRDYRGRIRPGPCVDLMPEIEDEGWRVGGGGE